MQEALFNFANYEITSDDYYTDYLGCGNSYPQGLSTSTPNLWETPKIHAVS